MSNLARRTFLHALVGATALVACAQSRGAEAQSLPAGRRTALSGYDPVSYFTDG